MIREQLKEMKEKRGLTNKELAEMSNVPLSTVSKIMSGHTDIPNYQTVCDLVIAMDGSLDALAGISKDTEPPGNVTVEMYVKIIAEKDQWLKRFFVICCIQATLLIGILLYALLKPM